MPGVPPSPTCKLTRRFCTPADRKAGAPLRLHSVPSVADLHVPYIYPSEPGSWVLV
jgi:hypothetical protein